MQLARSFIEIDSKDQEPAETTIKGYMPVGSIRGNGTVAVSAFEAVIPHRQLAFQGVRFEVSDANEYSSDGVTTIFIENAEKLIASLDNLASAKIDTSRFALSEIETNVDDLRIVVFNMQNGRLAAAVSVQGTTCHLNKQSDLYDLSQLVKLAVGHLHKNEIA